MGRLEVEIRHGGHGPGEWGAVIALIAFIVLAATGGAAHKELSSVAHDVLNAVEVALWAAAGLAVVAMVVGAVWIVTRVRAALRDARAPMMISLTPDSYGTVTGDDGRPALDAPRRRPAGWPLPGQWEQIPPRDGDDRRRYS